MQKETDRRGYPGQYAASTTTGWILHKLLEFTNILHHRDARMDISFFKQFNPDTGKFRRALPYADEQHPRRIRGPPWAFVGSVYCHKTYSALSCHVGTLAPLAFWLGVHIFSFVSRPCCPVDSCYFEFQLVATPSILAILVEVPGLARKGHEK